MKNFNDTNMTMTIFDFVKISFKYEILVPFLFIYVFIPSPQFSGKLLKVNVSVRR